jgi:hypothetical protein
MTVSNFSNEHEELPFITTVSMMEATPRRTVSEILFPLSLFISFFVEHIVPWDPKKINYHDHHGSVGSARLNITVVKETSNLQ